MDEGPAIAVLKYEVFEMSTKAVLAKTTIYIIVFTIISKLTGFGRDIALAYNYGASMEADAYLMAVVIPTTFLSIISAALATSYIPVLLELYQSKDEDAAFSFINNMINIVLALCLFITLLGILSSPVMVRLMAPSFSDEKYRLSVQILKIMFPMVIFSGITSILLGSLQAFNRFAAPALIGVPYNIIIIFTLVFFTKSFGIIGLAKATVIASISQVIIQLPSLCIMGFRYRFLINIKDQSVKKIGVLILPTILGLSVQQINVFVDKVLASGLAEGSISALNYAYKLDLFVLGVFTLAVATVIFPTLSGLAISEETEKLKNLINKALIVVSMILIPASVGLAVLRNPIVKLLFQRGVFDERAAEMTASGLLFYTVGLIGFGMMDILNRAFYALQDTKTPMLYGIFSVIINVLLNLILVRVLGLGGLALATSISAIFGALILSYGLYEKIGGFGMGKLAASLLRIVFASIAMGAAVYCINALMLAVLVSDGTLHQSIRLSISIIAGCIVYLIMLLLMKSDELFEAIQMIKTHSHRIFKKS